MTSARESDDHLYMYLRRYGSGSSALSNCQRHGVPIRTARLDSNPIWTLCSSSQRNTTNSNILCRISLAPLLFMIVLVMPAVLAVPAILNPKGVSTTGLPLQRLLVPGGDNPRFSLPRAAVTTTTTVVVTNVMTTTTTLRGLAYAEDTMTHRTHGFYRSLTTA
ncbi:uncharacterized protein BJ212DRAFT_1343147 [Suillus subaureus]|uniref:Uncharacterized protein n=1 Tax=Suillus subaureus TaxID=48587 RepID=A0A9P7JFN0_9AGAM|nr:uncharacterized protein BJ212DRAFT_1343147 [Suillus subaureus]KAG1819803.1 hypothetical protein BJ212DRAFT_1343147 [Suillus subaureus]